MPLPPQWIAAVLIEDPVLLALRAEIVFVRDYSKTGAKRVVERALQESGKLIGFEGQALTYDILRIEECREGREREMEAQYVETLQKAWGGRGHITKPE